ncbi:eCIS core domain-containing protein [Streptomyces purpurascens]|uniref:DUF4157 domain-containing protein n=1 Tax=Streptomyces purpurascens TaxID=1924 RepID=A0ABZ1MVX4_STREF|nr:DUF4157 domain-containing protein [Streptomyces purpurascens]
MSSTVARAAEEDGHAHEAVPDTSSEGQAALVAAAWNSPSESLPSSVTAKAVPFFQNDKIASTRVHRDAIAQRATAAMGAQAMTINNHIFLSAEAAGNEETIGHELSHVDKNTRGIPETGHSNGAGLSTTDPRQGSERSAGIDGAAWAAGESTAPSVAGDTVQRMTETGGPHQHGPGCGHGQRLTPTGTVQRVPAAHYLPGEDVEESPRYSVTLEASMNGVQLGSFSSKGFSESPGDHAEDQLLDYLEVLVWNYNQSVAAGNPDTNNALYLGRQRSVGTTKHKVDIVNLTASPCSTKRGTCSKEFGDGCTERLIEFATQVHEGHEFSFSIHAKHYYQPHGVEDAKSKSKKAVKDLTNNGVTVSIG